MRGNSYEAVQSGRLLHFCEVNMGSDGSICREGYGHFDGWDGISGDGYAIDVRPMTREGDGIAIDLNPVSI